MLSKSSKYTRSTRHPLPRLDILNKISQEKWALQGEISTPHRCRSLLWPGWDRWEEGNGMDERLLCRMGFSRSRPPFPPTFPSTAPRFEYGTPGSGLLMRRIDFTARAVSSDTSGPNETADPTLPSFKSRESAQKKRLNSTWERFAVPPLTFLDLRILNSSWRYQRVAYVYKAKKARQGSKVRVIWGYVFPTCFLTLSHLWIHKP